MESNKSSLKKRESTSKQSESIFTISCRSSNKVDPFHGAPQIPIVNCYRDLEIVVASSLPLH